MEEFPFQKTLQETQRHPENKRLLDEMGAYIQSLAIKPKRRASPEFGGTLTHIGDERGTYIDEKRGET